MPDGISVAEWLRQAAAMSRGPGVLQITTAAFLKLATELEPDWRERNPTDDAQANCGWEAIGLVTRWGYTLFYFKERREVDRDAMRAAYQLGYCPPRHPLPALRPRIRVRAGRG